MSGPVARWARAVAAAPLVAACADPVPEACAPLAELPAGVELGIGEEDVEAIVDDAVVPYFAGPQGGWHVFGALRARGILGAGPSGTFTDPDNPLVDFTIRADGGAFTDASAPVPRLLLPGGDGVELVGERVILDIPEASAAEGARVDYAVAVTDACGTTVRDARQIMLTFGGASN